MSLYQLFQALGLTVLHMLWIGTVIGGLAFVWLRSNPNADPRTRYACVVSGLMALLLATGVTFAFLASATPASTIVQTDAIVAATADVNRSSGEVLVRPRNVDTEAIGLERTPTVMIACAWLAGIALMSVRLFRQWVGVRRLRIIGVSEPSREWTEMFDALKSKIGVRSRVSMLVSDIVDAPMVVGWLRPLVLVPATAFTSLTPDQLQTVLAHELQHIARRDHLVNMLQAFIEVLLFFHPVTWWLSRQIRVERENCCDDSALLVTGSPRTFAEALLALESLRANHDKNDSTHLLTATGGLLMHRISRLFGSNQPRSLNAGWGAVSACTLLAVAGLTFGTAITDPIALAQDRGGSDARDIDLDELKAGIETRIEAMGEDLREQVANGEISEADAKARYAAAERRMWMRYRAAEERNATRGKSEVDYEAAAERMIEMVKNGEITKEQMQQRLDRMTQAETKKDKPDARRRMSRTDYDAAVERMSEMARNGEITKEQMQQRLDRMKQAGSKEGAKVQERADLDELK
ncbi:MAG: M56 family metallopeptidase, partial [Planctomycetota bacterium]